MKCKLKGGFLEIEERLSGRRVVGLRVDRRLKLSKVGVPHTRVKALLSDGYTDAVKFFGFRHRHLYHHIEILVFPSVEVFGEDFKPLKFQLTIEPFLKRFFDDVFRYGRFFGDDKKVLRKRKGETSEFLLEQFLRMFKEFFDRKAPVFIFLDLFLNTGDLYHTLAIPEEGLKTIELFPLIHPDNAPPKITRLDFGICNDFVGLAVSVADSIYSSAGFKKVEKEETKIS